MHGARDETDDWTYNLVGEPELFAGRGFTGHEWLPWFNLYNMNGRLYDPVVGRFLSPDNYVQMPDNTQNFNRYSYALNNPLKYTDPDGEWFTSLFLPIAGPFIDAFLWSATIDWAAQTLGNYASNRDGKFSDWAWNEVDWLDVGVSGTTSVLTMGLGNLKDAKKITETVYRVGKAINILAVPAVSSAFDLTPSEGFEVNNSSEFWNSYILDVVVTGISAKTGNEIVDGLLSDKPWILNDPLKGGLAKKLLELPLLIGSEFLENRSIPQNDPYPNYQPEIPEFRPTHYRDYNYNHFYKQSGKIDLCTHLNLNRY